MRSEWRDGARVRSVELTALGPGRWRARVDDAEFDVVVETLEDGRLIVNNANRHTGYGSNDCVTSAVDDYLITAKISYREKAC